MSPGDAEPRIRIRLLGRFSVWLAGQEVPARDFGGGLARQLLRILALSRGTLVSKESAAEALWPRRPPADASGNVEILVSRIRRALRERSLLRTGPGGYTLLGDDRCWIDVEAFLGGLVRGQAELSHDPVAALAAFRGALALWHGEPLAEDACRDWAQEHRRYLERAHLDALEGAAAAALATGDATSAVACSEAATERQPLREAAAMLLVRALAASGDQAAALATFDAFGRRLGEELGVDPSREAFRLRQQVLRGEVRTGVVGTGRTSGAKGDVSVPRLPFIGREDVYRRIMALLVDEGARVVLIRGVAGVGKSRLLAEVAERADVPTVSVRAHRAHRDDAWALARDVLRAASVSDRHGVAGQRSEEARAVSDLFADMPVALAGEFVRIGEGDRKAFTSAAALRLVDALARPRCLIAVDDLQWADDSSLSLLRQLRQRLPGFRLVAAHPGEIPPGGADPVQALAGADPALVRWVDLGGLATEALAELSADPVLQAIIVECTDHTPAAVLETLGTLVREGLADRDERGRWRLRSAADADRASALVSGGVRSLVRARVAALTADRREVLALLALMGRHAPTSVLASATSRDLRDTLDTLEALCRAGFAEGDGEGWMLTTEMVGDTIAEDLDPEERVRRHVLLAEALRKHGADDGEVARHLAAGGDKQEAAVAFANAAGACLGRVADREALRLAQAGLALASQGRIRARLLEIRGEAHSRRGHLREARADLERALEEVPGSPDRSRALARLAILESRSHDAIRGGELVELAIAEAGDDPAARGQALAAGAIIDLCLGQLDRARRRFHQARILLEQVGDTDGTARLLYWRGMASFVTGRLAEAACELDQLARSLVTPNEMLRLWNPRALRGHALVFMAEPAAGLVEIDKALARARATEQPTVHSSCLWHRSEALAALGRHAEALDDAHAALVIARRIEHVETTGAALRGLGVAWQAAGDLDRAEAAFRDSLHTAETVPLFAAWAAARLGLVLVGQGRLTEAEPFIDAALHHGAPLSRHEARWARAEHLHARRDDAGPAAAATALTAAREDGYLALAPRLAQLARP
jgi:DNA-binding SARP family transcriptional activator/tetratricopeptide (TPR) repeat protein